MQFSTIIATILAGASVTMAMPAKRQSTVCTGLGSSPQCCAVNVLNLADLNCATPPNPPTSMAEFIADCAAIGQQAQCCAIPILGQGLICSPPI